MCTNKIHTFVRTHLFIHVSQSGSLILTDDFIVADRCAPARVICSTLTASQVFFTQRTNAKAHTDTHTQNDNDVLLFRVRFVFSCFVSSVLVPVSVFCCLHLIFLIGLDGRTKTRTHTIKWNEGRARKKMKKCGVHARTHFLSLSLSLSFTHSLVRALQLQRLMRIYSQKCNLK